MMVGVGIDRDSLAAAVAEPAADDVLGRVYREHYGSLVGLARLLLDDRGVAEEVVQEAFARTLAGWRRLRSPDDPLPYVRRAVVNLARGNLRRRVVARARRPGPPDDAASAESVVLRAASGRAVRDAVAGLPDRQRACVVLRYYLDCSTAEAASALGISEGSVKTHLHRAVATLGSRLEVLR